MTEIHEFTTVHRDFEDARKALYEHFRDGNGTLALGVHVGELRIETDAQLRLRDKTEYPGYRILDVSWKPAHGGPFPEFQGTLAISQDAIDWSRLDLDGAYRPPLGILGAAFDAALGHRIAEATAAHLLAQLKAMLAEPQTAGVEQA